MQLFITFIKILPKNLLSYCVGNLVRITLPWPFNGWLNFLFVRLFKINMQEAEFELKKYRNIEAVFIRRLQANARSIEGPICSPADGTLSYSLPCKSNTVVQAKGLTYNLSTLVFGEEISGENFLPSWFFCVYLAPHNYHRVHAPFAASLTNVRYITGNLWPVNNIFCGYMPNLFTCNERLVFEFDVGTGRAYLVMVGALNVGRMTSPFLPLDFATNSGKRQLPGFPSPQNLLPTRNKINVGEELGTFMLGSTVVVVFDEKSTKGYNFQKLPNKQPIFLGQNLGKAKTPTS